MFSEKALFGLLYCYKVECGPTRPRRPWGGNKVGKLLFWNKCANYTALFWVFGSGVDR